MAIAFVDQPEQEAETRQTLGMTYNGLGELKKAAKQYRLATDIRRKHFADDLTMVARGANQLGALLHAVDQDEEVEPLM